MSVSTIVSPVPSTAVVTFITAGLPAYLTDLAKELFEKEIKTVDASDHIQHALEDIELETLDFFIDCFKADAQKEEEQYYKHVESAFPEDEEAEDGYAGTL